MKSTEAQRNRRIAISSLFALTGGVIVASLIPIASYPLFVQAFLNWRGIGDELLHAGLYTVFTFIVLLVASMGGRRLLICAIPVITTLTVLSGLLELIQPHLSPPRHASWRDFAANVIGIIAGALIGMVVKRGVKR